MATHVSSISQALAGHVSDVSIPKPVDAGDQSSSAKPGIAFGTGNLPTPPNSISPNLPPHSLKAKAFREFAGSPPSQLDSDIDLQDALDHLRQPLQAMHATPKVGTEQAPPENETTITPSLLAKHHLPGIILDKGPIAIRHVMNQLSQNVPGFAEVPPAKGRRIVVAALESKEGGGVNGEIEFEKVGWGRWDAHVKGQPPRENRGMYAIQEGNPSPLLGASSPYTPTANLRIPGASSSRRFKPRRLSHGSWTAESTNSEWMMADMPEDEADKMSIDGEEDAHDRYPSARVSVSTPSQRGFYSDTDEEDWEAMGFEALRANSLSRSGGRHFSFSLSRRSRSRSRVRNMPGSLPADHRPPLPYQQKHTPLDFSGVDANPQERDAIEALMRMGST